jgi:hypothetical protein
VSLAPSLPWEDVRATSGLVGWRATHPSPRGGLLFLPGSGGDAVRSGQATALLHAAGFTVVVVGLGWRADPRVDVDGGGIGGPAGAPPMLADHQVIADLTAARAWLPEGPRFVVGVGSAGVYSRVAGCAVMGLAGVISFGGRIWYSGVSATRPIQPLDLLPGLSCPLQVHVDEDDPDTPSEQIDELERRLSGVSRPWQVFRGPWRTAASAAAWGRARNLLMHLSAR